MFFWLLLTDKRLNRQNKIIWVTLPFLVPAQGTSVLLHPETMLITGSVYDLADIVPYFQTDRAHNLCQIHFTVHSAASSASSSAATSEKRLKQRYYHCFSSFTSVHCDSGSSKENIRWTCLFIFIFSTASCLCWICSCEFVETSRVQMKCRS